MLEVFNIRQLTKGKKMKVSALLLMGILSTSVSAIAAGNTILTEDQGKAIALVHAPSLYVSDDVLSIVHNGFGPGYSVSNVQHLATGIYRIDVRRMQPGQSCQQTLDIDDRSGALVDRQKLFCE